MVVDLMREEKGDVSREEKNDDDKPASPLSCCRL